MIDNFFNQIKLLILDIDGVVINGSTPIKDSIESLKKIKKKYDIFFLTNNSSRSRKNLLKIFKDNGIQTNIEKIITTAYCGAKYVSSLGLKSVYVIGEEGLIEECIEANLKIVKNIDEKCDVVLVGIDRNFNYEKLKTAFIFIRSGAKFIATNTDATLPTEKGELPGAGAMVYSLKNCTSVKPIILGKPNKYLIDLVLEKTNYTINKCAIVGDRPETDIYMAKKTGCLGVLVLTGISKSKNPEDYQRKYRPDYIFPSLSLFLDNINYH